ncbi:DNA helicase IV [Promicromonospora umidemergens]|uniref:AAA family ATPase n=1 Tax=Promicromonospora umidemergens TaxID=629679 RepID=A0ABP8XBP1_9MICO|nr:AAA family ATPase [Promicromonospora umidemergens]MCP2281554.1 DNA helicase IV [Promicromonospora umidemergens]
MPADVPELTHEREFLAEARYQLGRMRDRVAALDGRYAGDPVSADVLEAALARRMEQLTDDPEIPLFFGRIDVEESAETFHIGRRHVSDPDGEPMVVDWRAPVSTPFYRATPKEPMGITARRRYGFARGHLTGFEDEPLTGADLTTDGADAAAHSEILESEIERPRTGPMRDIVATIQPEQDVIVRMPLERTLVVQGAPGTGKTAVGLHRAAYLLYAHREQLTRRGVLVVGPNKSFLRYIRDVLPALGEIQATQATIEELVSSHAPVRGTEPADVATLKGDARMAAVLRRAVWSHIATPQDTLVLPRGSFRWRVPAYEAREAIEQIRSRDVRYALGGAQLRHALAHRVLVQIEETGDALDDRAWDVLARTKPVRDYAAAVWPVVDPRKLLLRLLTDPELLAGCAEGILSEAEQRLLAWDHPPRTAGSARWTTADVVLLDELADLLDRTESLAHIVVDEAQDLSAMMLRALGRRAATGSLTVLGDLAQATTPWASSDWSDVLGHLAKPDGHVEQLTAGFRVPADVIELAARLLPSIAPGLEPPTAVRRARGRLTITTAPLGDVLVGVAGLEGSVGLIVPDAAVPHVRGALAAADLTFAVVGEQDDERPGPDSDPDDASEFDAHLDLVPASLAKGLEFDHVVLHDPAGIVAAEPSHATGLRRLYVCLTRAVTSLVVRHEDDLPPELGPAASA